MYLFGKRLVKSKKVIPSVPSCQMCVFHVYAKEVGKDLQWILILALLTGMRRSI